jgi:hypothetical protein
MKNILLLTLVLFVTFLLSTEVQSQEMPKYLEGATVTVTLKNGKKYNFKSEEYAVVTRNSMGELAVVKTQLVGVAKKIERKELVKNKKNRVFGLVGRGHTGRLNSSTDGDNYSVSHETGTVFGVGYQRKVNDDFNLGIIIQNNQTTSFSLGKDF